jgi:uncharacterized membrane protein (UPF0127 family)
MGAGLNVGVTGGLMTWLVIVIRALVLAAAAAGMSPLSGCEGKATPAKKNEPPKSTSVTVGGKTYALETALTPSKQFQGLSGRTDIPADGGMVFVFPRAEERYFVMRDCPVPIDIVFLDAKMRVTAWHEMKPETPRTEAEKSGPAAQAYEQRLVKYHSKFPAQYVLEFKGGTVKGLNLKEGQVIELDPDLKKWTR